MLELLTSPMHNLISSRRWFSASLFRSSLPSVFIFTKRNWIARFLTISPPVLICENKPIRVPEMRQNIISERCIYSWRNPIPDFTWIYVLPLASFLNNDINEFWITVSSAGSCVCKSCERTSAIFGRKSLLSRHSIGRSYKNSNLKIA